MIILTGKADSYAQFITGGNRIGNEMDRRIPETTGSGRQY